MKKHKCIIVDDESLAIEVLENYINRINTLEIVAKCKNAISAFEALQLNEVDLMFLDIKMPKLTGLDLVRTLNNPPKIIITTAYRDYAFEGFELNVVDYLLKPVSFERFLKAVNKYIDNTQGKSIGSTAISKKVEEKTSKEDYLFVKANKEMIKIYYKNIQYIESIKDYVRIKTKDKPVITKFKISDLEQKLPSDLFLRIHRSFIISIDKVDAYCATFVKIENKELPIGRSYKAEVLKTLNIF